MILNYLGVVNVANITSVGSCPGFKTTLITSDTAVRILYSNLKPLSCLTLQ